MEESTRWMPYCGEAPGPEIWLSRWNLDPVLGAALLLLALALFRSSVGHDLKLQRLRSLRGAWALTVVLYVSPLCALSSAFFTVRVLHHIALVLVMAPLLVYGLEPWLRRLPGSLWSSTAIAAVGLDLRIAIQKPIALASSVNCISAYINTDDSAAA